MNKELGRMLIILYVRRMLNNNSYNKIPRNILLALNLKCWDQLRLDIIAQYNDVVEQEITRLIYQGDTSDFYFDKLTEDDWKEIKGI